MIRFQNCNAACNLKVVNYAACNLKIVNYAAFNHKVVDYEKCSLKSLAIMHCRKITRNYGKIRVNFEHYKSSKSQINEY